MAMNSLTIASLGLRLLQAHYIGCWRLSRASSNTAVSIFRVNIFLGVLDSPIWLSHWVLRCHMLTKQKSETLSDNELDSTPFPCFNQSRLHLQFSETVWSNDTIKNPVNKLTLKMATAIFAKRLWNFDILLDLLPKAEVIY